MSAIKVENIVKIYKLYDKSIDRLKEGIHPFGKKYHKDFYALNNISFEVKKGETLGLIGINGSGKSTLLKIITGLLTPTSGNIQVNGNVSALLELGAGFNMEYTGIENVYLNGMIMGFTREEMNKKMEEILSFADIGEFVKQPVKTYSSGMFVRLAFAVAINVNPEILIVDEALSVGDMRFQQKCFRKIEEFKKTKTVLFVSHDMGAINKFCDRIIWLDKGHIVEAGEPLEISKKYQAFTIESEFSKYKSDKQEVKIADDVNIVNEHLDVLGDQKANIIGVGILDAYTKEKLSIVTPGQMIHLIIKAKLYTDIEDLIIGFTINDRLGNVVTQSNSYILGEKIEITDNINKIIRVCFEFIIPNLNMGKYSISPAIASGTQENHIQHSWVHDAVIFEVYNKEQQPLPGYLFLEPIKFYIIE